METDRGKRKEHQDVRSRDQSRCAVVYYLELRSLSAIALANASHAL